MALQSSNTTANTVLYTVTFSGLTTGATLAHIHQGPVGVSGPVMVPFSLGEALGQTSGAFSGTGIPNAGFDVSSIIASPADFYVNVHSTMYPSGEIRGQLTGCAAASQLSVSTQDQDGRAIAGYYTVLYNQSSILATGFSPTAFPLANGQTYMVQVDDFGSCTFDHWPDTGSTNGLRAVSISSDTQITALYSCVTSTISVSTNSSDGSPLTGYFVSMWLSNGTPISSCFSPCTLTVDSGQYYTVTAANFGTEIFDHWSDGGGSVLPWGGSHQVIIASAATTLTAVYTP